MIPRDSVTCLGSHIVAELECRGPGLQAPFLSTEPCSLVRSSQQAHKCVLKESQPPANSLHPFLPQGPCTWLEAPTCTPVPGQRDSLSGRGGGWGGEFRSLPRW